LEDGEAGASAGKGSGAPSRWCNLYDKQRSEYVEVMEERKQITASAAASIKDNTGVRILKTFDGREKPGGD
jgi:hypothetical protein